MSPKDAVLAAVNALPPDATPDEIWDHIANSLPGFGDAPPEEDPAWLEEINRRVDGFRTGKVKGVPAEVLFPELNEPAE